MGFISWVYDWNWDAAEKSLNKALSINPNYPDARRWLSHVHITMGNISSALEEIDKGIKLEPNSGNMLSAKSQYLAHSGKIESAIKTAQEAFSRNPSFIFSHQALAEAHLMAGNHDSAIKSLEQGDELYPGEFQLTKAEISATRGDYAEAKKILNNEIKKRGTDVISSTEIAWCFYLIEEDIKALDYLELAVKEKDTRIVYLHANFDWKRISSTERFKSISKKLNLPLKP